ncbi:uncharacterized protein LOC116937073 isoform X4 [Petromyzon marinus]|uniref:uncharacterized protein LOC142907050 isoform X6 n=1 Tax=Petromyzon marinus TaxID=7757 RepID=UPI003F70AE7E
MELRVGVDDLQWQPQPRARPTQRRCQPRALCPVSSPMLQNCTTVNLTDVSLLREESDGTGAGLAHGTRSALLLAERRLEAPLSPLRSDSYVDVSDSKQYSSSVKMWTTDLSQTPILHRGPHALHTSHVSSEPQQRRLDVPACPLNDT